MVQGSAALVDYFAGRGGGAAGGNRDEVAELGTSDHCDAKPAPRPGRLHHEQLPSNRSWRAFNILTSISCSGGHGAQPLGPGWPARRLPAGEYSPAQPPWQRSEGCCTCEYCVAETDSDWLRRSLQDWLGCRCACSLDCWPLPVVGPAPGQALAAAPTRPGTLPTATAPEPRTPVRTLEFAPAPPLPVPPQPVPAPLRRRSRRGRAPGREGTRAMRHTNPAPARDAPLAVGPVLPPELAPSPEKQNKLKNSLTRSIAPLRGRGRGGGGQPYWLSLADNGGTPPVPGPG